MPEHHIDDYIYRCQEPRSVCVHPRLFWCTQKPSLYIHHVHDVSDDFISVQHELCKS